MRRYWYALSLLWVCSLSFPAHPAQVVSHPFVGITFISRTEPVPRPMNIRLVQIDLQAPGIRFKMSPQAGFRDTLRMRTVDFLRQERAQVAINAHFYWPYTLPEPEANLVGFAASEGVIYSPFENQPIAPGFPDQGYAIVRFGPAINIDRCNRATILHHALESADRRQFREQAEIWTALSGSAQVVSNGVLSIPTYTGPPHGLSTNYIYSENLSWYNALRARTLIGLSQDSKVLTLFTVDEIAGSFGMTVVEAADMLIKDYQVYQAINLDGNGSTSLAMEDPRTQERRLMNVSSDGGEGRVVGSSLAVFALRHGEAESLLRISRHPKGGHILSLPAKGAWELQSTTTLRPPQWEKVPVLLESKEPCREHYLPLAMDARYFRVAQGDSSW